MLGYKFSFRDPQPAQAQLVYFPCAPGCRGSESDSRYCRCVCRGINHGCLVFGRPIRPVPVPSEGYNPHFEQLPEEHHNMLPDTPVLALPDKTRNERLIFPVARGIGKIAKPAGRSLLRSFKHSLAGYSQTELNENVFNGLRKQYNQENTEKVITAAQTEFYMQNPNANTPELYELYENGDIDRALSRDGKAWVIGRPKKR